MGDSQRAGLLAVLVGIVVRLVLLVERLGEHFAEQEQTGVVAQADVEHDQRLPLRD